MRSKLLGVALMAVITTTSAQTIYRTVTGSGKVIFSDTPVSHESTTKLNQVTNYSSSSLSATNITKPVDGSEGASDQSIPACQSDSQKYCVRSSNNSQAFECLLDHQKDVTNECYDALKKKITSSQNNQGSGPVGQSCKQDTQQFCKGIQPGEGRIINCLLDHQKDISDACYSALAKQKQKRQ